MTAHTPGPWKYRNGSVWVGSSRVASVNGVGAVGLIEQQQRVDANARLIAAAPDLLDALQAWIDWNDGLISGMADRRERAMRMTIAAIAKATGNSS